MFDVLVTCLLKVNFVFVIRLSKIKFEFRFIGFQIKSIIGNGQHYHIGASQIITKTM